MTSAEIRQSFLDFFREKRHTIVPSSSLLPDAPNLLFTNAGMNQFVPIFLGQRAPDVDKWPGAIAGSPLRAADTQKCIRAGGKHNDLEDVGLDTYHHTFFEMLGNWSFGDYFKREAIDWAWELLVDRWHFPRERLYATYFQGDDATPADTEARDLWRRHLPADHVLPGGRKDNFWMMGDTGPCGPCSEIHIDLTPAGDGGKLVNVGDAQCIEIWNLVFIQFNSNPDGSLTPLAAKHVDTGMGFERVCSMIQCTKGFQDFTRRISNYETDTFAPIFRELEKLSGQKYTSTLPSSSGGASVQVAGSEQIKIDVAFRVVADHIRCLSFAIADGILPSNEGRGYVLRRILRRAIRYGRSLGFREPFFYKLVDVVAANFGDVFSELRRNKAKIQSNLKAEEESFNRTLDRGIEIFDGVAKAIEEIEQFLREAKSKKSKLEAELEAALDSEKGISTQQGEQLMGRLLGLTGIPTDFDEAERYLIGDDPTTSRGVTAYRDVISNWNGWWMSSAWGLYEICNDWAHNNYKWEFLHNNHHRFKDGLARIEVEAGRGKKQAHIFPADEAFKLYDTYGFPLDLTELMARERGLSVDVAGFEKLMAEQRERAREDHDKKKSVVTVATENLRVEPTEFLGYDNLEAEAVVEAVETISTPRDSGVDAIIKRPDSSLLLIEFKLVLDRTPFYAEMGGQVGDTGLVHVPGHEWTEIGRLTVLDTQKQGKVYVHHAKLADGRAPEVGEAVRVAVNAARRANIQRHHTVTHLFHWALHEVVSRDARQKGSLVAPDRLRFDFNQPEKLSDQQIADIERLVNERIKENARVFWFEMPYSEVRGKPDIMQFFGDKYGDIVRIVQIGGHDKALDGFSMELCGGTHTKTTGEIGLFKIMRESAVAAGIRRVEAVCGQFAEEFIEKQAGQEQAEAEKAKARELEKELAKQRQAAMQSQAPAIAERLLTGQQGKLLVANLGDANAELLRAVIDVLKTKVTSGVVVLGGVADGKVSLICYVTSDLVKQGKHAGKIVGELARICGGGGGGKPDLAQAGGKLPDKLAEALAAAARIIGAL
jgi:alanyl-tRNA synthetase